MVPTEEVHSGEATDLGLSDLFLSQVRAATRNVCERQVNHQRPVVGREGERRPCSTECEVVTEKDAIKRCHREHGRERRWRLRHGCKEREQRLEFMLSAVEVPDQDQRAVARQGPEELCDLLAPTLRAQAEMRQPNGDGPEARIDLGEEATSGLPPASERYSTRLSQRKAGEQQVAVLSPADGAYAVEKRLVLTVSRQPLGLVSSAGPVDLS